MTQPPAAQRQGFDHERLEVYRAALVFLQIVESLQDQAPTIRKHLADQLDRASTSIVLNIAEGAGEFSPPEKARFYRMARRSATECAAVLDILRIRGLCGGDLIEQGRVKLLDIVSMLTSMVRNISPEVGAGGRVREMVLPEASGDGDSEGGRPSSSF
jgi:four helix bundle protein